MRDRRYKKGKGRKRGKRQEDDMINVAKWNQSGGCSLGRSFMKTGLGFPDLFMPWLKSLGEKK